MVSEARPSVLRRPKQKRPPQALGRPECAWAQAMNYYNISRATQGLVAYVKDALARGAERKALNLHSATTRASSRANSPNSPPRSSPKTAATPTFLRAPLDSRAFLRSSSHKVTGWNQHNRKPQSAGCSGYKVYFEDGGQVWLSLMPRESSKSQCGRERCLHTGRYFRARKGDPDGF